ncbi:MAG: hypothetical protein WCF23_05870 [Candidatus Nitrosopolaris sp.]
MSVVSNIQISEAALNVNVNNTQIWTNAEQNLKIQFSYQPQKPILDQHTELKIAVQNLRTAVYLKNFVADILVTHNSSGQFSNFRFSNITVPDGQFSVKYLFPDTGIYEIITRVSVKEIAALAAFKVIVPLQSYPPIAYCTEGKTIEDVVAEWKYCHTSISLEKTKTYRDTIFVNI